MDFADSLILIEINEFSQPKRLPGDSGKDSTGESFRMFALRGWKWAVWGSYWWIRLKS